METATKVFFWTLAVAAIGGAAWATWAVEPAVRLIVPDEATAAMVEALNEFTPGAWPPSDLEQLTPGRHVALGVSIDGCGGFILARVDAVSASNITVATLSPVAWQGCSPAASVEVGSVYHVTLDHVFLLAPEPGPNVPALGAARPPIPARTTDQKIVEESTPINWDKVLSRTLTVTLITSGMVALLRSRKPREA